MPRVVSGALGAVAAVQLFLGSAAGERPSWLPIVLRFFMLMKEW